VVAAPIFRGLDRDGLDREYNNHAKVVNSAEALAWFPRESAAARAALQGRYDSSFGPHPAETLEVFAAETEGCSPIHIHVHGGYWQRMSKDDYSFVARTLVPAGAAVVLNNYALMPTVTMDELVRQCRAAVAWAYRNAASFRGDPNRMFVSGHSAGGHLVAMLMATDWQAFASDLPAGLLKGGVALSGLYDLEPIRLCYLNDVLRLSAEEARRNSPIHLVPAPVRSLIISVGELEGPEYRRQLDTLVAAWRKYDMPIEVIDMPSHHHFSMLTELGSVNSPLTRALLAQMELKGSS
jgi:arylformamidase